MLTPVTPTMWPQKTNWCFKLMWLSLGARGRKDPRSAELTLGAPSIGRIRVACGSGVEVADWKTCAINRSKLRVGLDPLKYGGEALAAADAHGFEAVAGFAAVHFVEQCGEDADAGGADGVAERDAGAVHVDAVVIGGGEAEGLRAGEDLRRKRLVQFDQVEVGEGKVGALERLPR